ncbi:sensor protein KdpD [Cytophagaceae bacterium YF14B1]|uniref:Sensor protein KdpD n=1 Tax=Xanthocytophaga flava TaxID=3048013 RepID=A0AAE3QRF5_9BACT|nr:sensor protein KdpD [Xanthocytophaga flavus]MDJ1482068.1 sensor protein KdpD [Xanthocytophaga flavus]
MPELSQNESADHFLQLIQKSRKGKFKLYIGMSAGVGKTYRMLQEAHQLIRSGINLKIGFVETHNRAETAALVGDLPTISRKKVFYKSKELEEMDLQSILNQHPEVVIVDELAHTNIPGSKNEKRWQDVVELLQAGISVISAVNIQHLESLNNQVYHITSVEVSERVPDHVLRMADEIVNIDLPADELIQRLKDGKIYHGAKIAAALSNFFRSEQILQLRELALKEVAYQVEKKIETEVLGPNRLRPEKLLACISSNNEGAQKIIRQTARLASYYDASWYVVYVQTPREDPDKIKLASQRHLINNFKLATEMGAEVIRVKNKSVSDAVLNIALEKQISFIILGKPHFNHWNFVLKSTLLRNMLLKTESTPIDLIIVS